MPASSLADEKYSIEEIAYHYDIMKQSGLIEATIIKASGGKYSTAIATMLTWSGNDFLANIESDDTWTKVKRKIAKTTGDASLSIFIELAVVIAKQTIGL